MRYFDFGCSVPLLGGLLPLLAATTAAGPVRAQGVKLNRTLARPVGGDIRAQRIDPRGEVLVYVADQERDETFDLYALKLRALAPVAFRLNRSSPEADVELDFQISADGRFVVYRADTEIDQRLELYSVPIDGSAPPVRISGPLGDGAPSSRAVRSFAISPDARRVVYRANALSPISVELFSVPITGGAAPLHLNGPLVFHGGDVEALRISPDGRRVLYAASQDVRVLELYSVPIDGRSGAVKLNGPLVPPGPAGLGGSLGVTLDFQIGADGQRAFFRVDQLRAGNPDLFSAPIAGRPAVRLNQPSTALRMVTSFALSPDARQVVYLADDLVDGVFELFVAPAAGGATPLRLSGPMVHGGDVAGFEIAPDGARVAYTADQDTDDVVELYSSRLDGGALAQKLNPPLVAGGDVLTGAAEPGPLRGVQLGADGTVVYRAIQEQVGVTELFSVPLDASRPAVKLSATPVAGGDVIMFLIGNGAGRVAYVADQDANDVLELYGAPLAGGAPPVRLSQTLVPGGDVALVNQFGPGSTLALDPVGVLAVYLADAEADDAGELFRARLDGSSAPTKLNGALARGAVAGAVRETRFTPDGKRALYLADQEEIGVIELYSVSTRRREAPVRLNAPLPPGGGVVGQFQAAGGRVLYRAEQESAEELELFSVPEQGGSSVKLSPPLVPGGNVGVHVISPDESRVALLAETLESERYELFSAPLDGAAAPVRLNEPLVAGGGVSGVQISADSSFAVYRADQELVQRSELYRVPLGGGTAHKVSGTLASGEFVSQYRITTDGQRVVFSVVAESSIELRSAPADGSAPPVRLDALSGAGRVVGGFELSPDGTRVAFRADLATTGVYQLFVVPADGAQPALELSAPVVSGFGVSPGISSRPVRFTADGTRIVYLANRIGALEIHSVPADGHAPPVTINAPFSSGGGVALGFFGETAFELTPDSSRVVFYSRATATGPTRVQVVPVDGGVAPVELAPPSVSVAAPARITSDSRRVVFLGAEGGLNRFYVAELQGAPRLRAISGGFRTNLFSSAALSPRSDQAVFIADQQTEELMELFLTPLERPLLPSSEPERHVLR